MRCNKNANWLFLIHPWIEIYCSTYFAKMISFAAGCGRHTLMMQASIKQTGCMEHETNRLGNNLSKYPKVGPLQPDLKFYQWNEM